jgi:hypothetical protein
MCGTIKRNLKNKTSMETQIKVYKVMAVSAGLYGSKNWVLAENDKNRVQATEMRFLRSLLGVTGQDRLSNEAIRETIYTSASLGGNKITQSNRLHLSYII